MNMRDYKIILKMIEKKYGRETAEEIKHSASVHYMEFEETVEAAKNRMAKMHLTFIAERCAMYLALKEKFPAKAYKWIDKAVEIQVSKKRKVIDLFTRIPGMKYVFIKLGWKAARSMFGEKAGFQQRIRICTKDMVAFDMLECPYCKYCKMFGCEELTRSFCDSDEYAYNNLKNIEFIRTKTLGTGGDCCDFCYKIRQT